MIAHVDVEDRTQQLHQAMEIFGVLRLATCLLPNNFNDNIIILSSFEYFGACILCCLLLSAVNVLCLTPLQCVSTDGRRNVVDLCVCFNLF